MKVTNITDDDRRSLKALHNAAFSTVTIHKRTLRGLLLIEQIAYPNRFKKDKSGNLIRKHD